MINIRRGVARIGYVLLIFWEGGWLATIIWGELSGKSHWSPESLVSLLVLLVGYPLGIFLLWHLLLWILRGFKRTT
jgi:hypothetical protein